MPSSTRRYIRIATGLETTAGVKGAANCNVDDDPHKVYIGSVRARLEAEIAWNIEQCVS